MKEGNILAFWFFASGTVIFALLVVLSTNLMRGVLSLFFMLLFTAGIYFSLGADFMGAVQIILYVGGVIVLIAFGVLLTKDIRSVSFFGSFLHTIFSFLFSAGLVGILWFLSNHMPETKFPPVHHPITPIIGELFMKKYSVPFELASILLVGILIGAAYLVRREVR